MPRSQKAHDAELVALEFLASLEEITARFAEHAKAVVDQNPNGTSDDDWKMAFIEDANEILIAMSNLNRRLGRLEQKCAGL